MLKESLAKKDVGEKVQLLLGNAEKYDIPEDAIKIKNKLKRIGIRNVTIETIESAEKKKESIDRDIAKNTLLINIANNLSPFKIVPYSKIVEKVREYNCIIAPISWYKYAIPQDVLDEVNIFLDDIKTAAPKEFKRFLPLETEKRNGFTFDTEYLTSNCAGGNYNDIGLKIAAPVNHFNFPNHRNIAKVDCELHYKERPKVKLKPSFKLDLPKVKNEDPLIFTAFNMDGKIYCPIAGGWDKIYDDEAFRVSLNVK